MSDTTLILDAGWAQLDPRKRGHIPPLDLPLLIDAIESNLSAPLLDTTQLSQIKQFARTSVQKVYKSEFKALFRSICAMDFDRAVKRAGVEKATLEMLRNEVLTSTPLRGGSGHVEHERMEPSFRKEFKQYKRLSESQEKEIEYRDDVIQKLERKELELEKYIVRYKEATKTAKDLEDDVLYRDKIIVERDGELKEREKECARLKEEVKRWKEEARIWQTQNEDEWKRYVAKKEQNFNTQLLQRIEQQRKQIELLKSALAQTSRQVAQTPIKIEPLKITTRKHSNRDLLYIGMAVLLLIIWLYPTSRSKAPWFEGTWLEPYIFDWYYNNDVDWDYYNLGNIDEEYLMAMGSSCVG